MFRTFDRNFSVNGEKHLPAYHEEIPLAAADLGSMPPNAGGLHNLIHGLKLPCATTGMIT
jgi:hypothetical protein